jgi:hypothetical protein
MTEQFIQERRYLLGVSPRTIIWYQCSFKAFEGAMTGKEAVRQRIVDLRQRNVSTITINSYLLPCLEEGLPGGNTFLLLIAATWVINRSP